MKYLPLTVIFLLVSSFSPCISGAHADEDIEQIFKKVQEYVDQKNYTKALEELSWAREEIERRKNDGLKNFFPDELSGLKGKKIEVSAALGMTNVERQYDGGDATVKVSLVGGGKGGAFGQLVGMGRMAQMMQQGQGNRFRINGLTASLDESGARPELSVFLESGGILKIEGRKNADGDKLKQVAKAMDLSGLDKYLKGEVSQPANGGNKG